MRYIYSFKNHFGNIVDVGPYTDEVEAKNYFQRVYGYYPANAVYKTQYDVIL